MRVLNSVALVAAMVCSTSLNLPADSAAPTDDIKNLTLNLNTAGIANSIHKNVISTSPNHTDEPPFMNGEPKHLRVTFDNEKVSDYTDYLQKQLLVYPTKTYSLLFHNKEKIAFDHGMSQLKKIIATKSDTGIKQIFILPSADAFEMFHNQEKYLKFKHGSGIAFLTCYSQDYAPIKNGDFFYTFQGLTSDGKYYVSLFFPIEVKNLPKTTSYKKTIEFLGKLPRKQFTPSLDVVDNMIQSISVE